MSNYDKYIVITNRELCEEDYLTQLDKVCALHPKALILREKKLNKSDYENVATIVKQITYKHNVKMFIHTYDDIARNVACPNLHLSFEKFGHMREDITDFKEVSVSCHTVEEVRLAVSLGASQIVLGNIYETDCKKGLPGKGIDFLREACEVAGEVPVYAIGGIGPENIKEVLNSGAAGGCMMSGFMRMKL